MSPLVVADAGPIISFARANELGLLRTLLPSILIPDAVYDEVTRGVGRPGAAAVEDTSWIRSHTVKQLVVASVSPALDRGERNAVALALELGATVLVDDRQGRTEAARLGVPTITTLILLATAKDRGHIAAVGPILDRLRQSGFYLSHPRYEEFLTTLGE